MKLRHNYIEIYIFVSNLAYSTIFQLLQQLIFKVECQKRYNLDLDSCKSNPELNDSIQKILSDLMRQKNIIQIFISSISIILLTLFLMYYKSIKIIAISIFSHTLTLFMILCFSLFNFVSSKFLVLIYGFLISFCDSSSIFLFYNVYISHKSSPDSRLIRFVSLQISTKVSRVIGMALFGILIKKIGFTNSIVLQIIIVFISTLVFVTLEEFDDINTWFISIFHNRIWGYLYFQK